MKKNRSMQNGFGSNQSPVAALFLASAGLLSACGGGSANASGTNNANGQLNQGDEVTLRYRALPGEKFLTTSETMLRAGLVNRERPASPGSEFMMVSAMIAMHSQNDALPYAVSIRTGSSQEITSILPNGNFEIAGRTSGVELQVRVAGEAMGEPIRQGGEDQVSRHSLTPRGVVVDVHLDEATAGQNAEVQAMVRELMPRILAFASIFELPEEAIRVGTVWDHEHSDIFAFQQPEFSMRLPLQAAMHNRLARLEGQGASRRAVTAVDGTFTVPMTTVNAMGKTISLQLSCRIDGEQQYSVLTAFEVRGAMNYACELDVREPTMLGGWHGTISGTSRYSQERETTTSGSVAR